MIAAQGLSFRYGQKSIVTNVSFTIARGEIVGLLGPNGAGKTTCLRVLAGYLPTSSGTATLEGVTITPHAASLRQRIGYVAEQAPLFADLTPHEHLQLTLECHRLPQRDVPALLDTFDLVAVQHHPVQTLSKGYRRRVALAIAFAAKPAALLLDEPGDGLDPNQKRKLGEILQAAASDAAILLSTHQLDDAERFCSRVLLMHGGHVRFDGSPAGLRARAQDGSMSRAFADLTGLAA